MANRGGNVQRKDIIHKAMTAVTAKIFKNVGWSTAQATALNATIDSIADFIVKAGTKSQELAVHAMRAEPTMRDVEKALVGMHVHPEELLEFMKSLEPEKAPLKLPLGLRKPQTNALTFRKPSERELRERPDHIPAHLPAMLPSVPDDLEDEVVPSNGPAKASGDDEFIDRRLRELPEEAGPSNYELKSVSMSNTGQLLGEGRFPDPRTAPPQTPSTPAFDRPAFGKRYSPSNGIGASSHLDSDSDSPPPIRLPDEEFDIMSGPPRGQVKSVTPQKSPPVVAVAFSVKPRQPGQPKSPIRGYSTPLSPSLPLLQPAAPQISLQTPKKSPGRPPKSKKRSPGRPPKSPGHAPKSPRGISPGRGRPPKRPAEESVDELKQREFKDFLITGEPPVGAQVPTKAQLKSPPAVKRLCTSPPTGRKSDSSVDIMNSSREDDGDKQARSVLYDDTIDTVIRSLNQSQDATVQKDRKKGHEKGSGDKSDLPPTLKKEGKHKIKEFSKEKSKSKSKSKSQHEHKPKVEQVKQEKPKEPVVEKLLIRLQTAACVSQSPSVASGSSEDRESKKSKKKHRSKERDDSDRNRSKERKIEKPELPANITGGPLKLTLKIGNTKMVHKDRSRPPSNSSSPPHLERSTPTPSVASVRSSPSPAPPPPRLSRHVERKRSAASSPSPPDLKPTLHRPTVEVESAGVVEEVYVPPVPVTPKSASKGKKAPVAAVCVETQGKITDENGEIIWICPACKKQDDGSPMIGCESCDDWYHWACVGITQEPPKDEEWFCPKHQSLQARKGAKKGAKSRGKQKRKK